ncbi:MAG: UDP-N-acetylmuramoyl-tripeptide--D-alanyl-D-alanine ligase [Sedimenticola sp.]
MISFTTTAVAEQLGGRHLGPEVRFSSVSTDTRSIRDGDFFVALQGPNFDAHDFLGKASEAGAGAAMVSRESEIAISQVVVPDTRIGLGRLAALWRQASGAPLVAVTGSNGKTTVKEMIAAILEQAGSVLSTQGNLNNDIGLPLTLMRLQEHDYAVVEMGANHAGEIGYLSDIARPDVAVLNNAGRAHLEGFGSLEGVARAKAEIVSGLGDEGRFVFNADDDWAPLWGELGAGHALCTFGVRNEADVFSPEESWQIHWSETGFSSRFRVVTPEGEVEIELALAGDHNRMNALAAIAAAQLMGATLEQIRAGLASLAPVKGRLQPLVGRNRIGLIDDSYNANPDSVSAAINVLSGAPGRRYLVLGELAEMGEAGHSFYRELGEHAREAGIEHLYVMGDASAAADAFGDGSRHFASHEDLAEELLKYAQPGDRVLVKGSRKAAMEKVINVLTEEGTD